MNGRGLDPPSIVKGVKAILLPDEVQCVKG